MSKRSSLPAMSWKDIAPTGVYPIPGANAVFLEPCRIITSAYSHFFVLPHLYYCRSFFLSPYNGLLTHDTDMKQHKNLKKKKKKKKRKLNPFPLNPKELRAQHRHEAIREFILDAYKAFAALPDVSSLLKGLENHLFECKASQFVQDSDWSEICTEMIDYVKLGNVWQAPLYNITLSDVPDVSDALDGLTSHNTGPVSSFPLFKHMVQNTGDKELLGACAGTITIVPKKSRFLMSDLVDIRQLLSSHKGDGYNLILIDPPWENKSVHRHATYSTLPNKHLFFLPLKELAHHHGALVGLWVTNREKLRAFVEDELFPAWGAHIQATWFWLKIKSDGQMITELDMPHHKPYECLLLGYMPPQGTNIDLQIPAPKAPPDKKVIISIPGDHSRKPPLQLLLSEHVPGEGNIQGLELFSRDINSGWTSWGNEPLRFQQIHYFGKKSGKNA